MGEIPVPYNPSNCYGEKADTINQPVTWYVREMLGNKTIKAK